MQRCLVIGGSGFIGKHVTEELLQSGRDVSILDIRKPDAFEHVVNFYNSSESSDADLVNILGEHNEVIDLAYLSNPKTSYDDPLKDIVENLQSTVKIFGLALQSKQLEKFLYVSSGGAIYGNTSQDLIPEDHGTNPVSPYGITKLAIEKYGFMFCHAKGFPFVAVRPSNAYGPGQGVNRGQGFIAQSIYNILHDEAVVVFGEHGTIRDYIYITDLAKGIVAVLDKGKIGEMYNLGTGVGSSNMDVLRQLESICAADDKKVICKKMPERKFDVNKNMLDCSKVQQHCGWKAAVDLKQGLKHTWKYYYQLQP
jgi:UDP-glucose 4-epimerase